MKQKIAPTSPKKRDEKSKEIESVYQDPTLNHLEKPTSRGLSVGSLFFMLCISLVGGACAAVVIVLQGERIGIISMPQSETTIIVRDGAEQFSEGESFADSFISASHPSLLRLYAQELPSGENPRAYVTTQGTFVGYAILLTTDGKAFAPSSVLNSDTTYIAENWNGALQTITDVVRDERSGLAFFTFPGNGFRAVDLLDEGESIPDSSLVVLNYRPEDVKPSFAEASLIVRSPVQLLNPDLYVWPSELFFSSLLLSQNDEYPRGTPIFRSDGVLVGLYDGTKENPQVLGVSDRRPIMNTFLSGKTIAYPYLGVSGIDIGFVHTIPAELRANRDAGFLLTSTSDEGTPAVTEDSPADQAGLQEGDLIIGVNSTDLTEPFTLGPALYRAQGEEVSLRVVRDGTERTFSVTLGTL